MRRKLILIAVSALFATAVANAPRRVPAVAFAANLAQADAQADEKDGDKLRLAHQYQAAIDAYQKALTANPKLASAYIGMGIAYLKMHYYDEAEAALKKGLVIAPKDVTSLRYLSETYCGEIFGRCPYRSAEAADITRQALALAPDLYDLHLLLALATDSKDERKLEMGKAEALAELAASHNPEDSDACRVLARVNYNLGNYDEAGRWGKKQIELDSGDAEAHFFLGVNYYLLKKWSDAIAELQTAIKIDPDYLHYHAQLGYAYKQSGRQEDSKAEFREAVRLAPLLIQHAPRNAFEYRYVAQLYLFELDRDDDALTWYRKAVEAAPGDFWAHSVLADVYRNRKRFADAVPEYQAATRIKPKEPEPWASLTYCYFELSQWTDVISAGEQSLKLKGDQGLVHNELGLAYYNLKRYPEAIAHDKEAIRLSPNDPILHNNLAFAQIGAGDRDGAMAEYNILKGLDAANAAELLKYLNPQQSTAQPTPELPPRYEYFRARTIKSETEVPYGHENSGYYIYNTVTNLNTGRECTLRCWEPLHPSSGWYCYRMRGGETYNAKREYKMYDSKRGYEYMWTYIEMNVDGADVWVEFLGCGKD